MAIETDHYNRGLATDTNQVPRVRNKVCSTNMVWFAAVFLALVLLTLVGTGGWPAIQPHGTCHTESSKMVFFSDDDEFQSLNDTADAHWENIVPSNGGFLLDTIPNAEWPYEPGKEYKYGISMFHQLHCLRLIREALKPTSHETDELVHSDKHDHVVHCLDYLRQNILCQADDTIEPPRRNKYGGANIDYTAIAHQCRDSQRLYTMVEGDGRLKD